MFQAATKTGGRRLHAPFGPHTWWKKYGMGENDSVSWNVIRINRKLWSK